MPNNDYNSINKLYTFELESVDDLMAQEELEQINRNKSRKRGRNEFNK